MSHTSRGRRSDRERTNSAEAWGKEKYWAVRNEPMEFRCPHPRCNAELRIQSRMKYFKCPNCGRFFFVTHNRIKLRGQGELTIKKVCEMPFAEIKENGTYVQHYL